MSARDTSLWIYILIHFVCLRENNEFIESNARFFIFYLFIYFFSSTTSAIYAFSTIDENRYNNFSPSISLIRPVIDMRPSAAKYRCIWQTHFVTMYSGIRATRTKRHDCTHGVIRYNHAKLFTAVGAMQQGYSCPNF